MMLCCEMKGAIKATLSRDNLFHAKIISYL